MNAVNPPVEPRPRTPQGCSVIAVALGSLLCLWVPSQALAQETSEESILRFGVIGRGEDVQPDEFTALLLREIEWLEGVSIEFVPIKRARAEGALHAGIIDFTNLNHTPQRAVDLELSDPHSQQSLAIFRHIKSQDIVDLESLSGRTVGVRNFGLLPEALAARTDAKIIPYAKVLRGLLALNRSEIDAFVCGQSRGASTVLRQELTDIEMTAPGFMSEDSCFAARKGNHELISMLNRCLDQLATSGRLQMLADQIPPQVLDRASWVRRNRLALIATGVFTSLLFLSVGWILVLHRTNRAREQTDRRLDQSLSLLRSTLESTADGILVVDVVGKIVASNRRFRELWRIPDSIMESGDDEQAIFYVLEQLEDPQDFLRKVGELYDHPEAESFDVLRFSDGRIYERYSQPQRIEDQCVGRVWSFRDVTERTNAEQRQKQMIDELDHRVKNMLATVQAISDETLDTAESPAAFVELFRGRIASLTCVHEVLAQRGWQGANLQELIDRLVSPYGADDDTRRFEISGDDVVLPVASVLPFSLALHELATNAAKYGALSVPEGTVEIKWNLPTVDKREVLLRWIERDGPEVAEPTRRGFGTRFIEQGITYELGGEVTLQFEPAGLHCEMRIPI